VVCIRDRIDIDSGFVIFGLENFRRRTTLFDANLTGPVDAGYRLGPGDHLVLVLTGDVEAAYQLEVTREGFIVIPQVGQLHVNNLTLADLEDLLYARLGRVYSGVRRGPGATTRFSISPARLRSNQVFVHGDVLRPGSHRISSAGTVMTALYAAGGPTDDGSLRRVEIRRGGRLAGVLDVYDYLLRGDASGDVRLQNGDIVFVPIHGPRVRIVGEIARPATYELKGDETLNDAIRFAGGFKASASLQRIQVERILPPAMRSPGRDRVIMDVATNPTDGSAPAAPVLAGDVVRVFPVTTRVRNRVVVRGNVWSPGPQGITPGQTSLSEVLRTAGGVKPDTYLGQVLISRLQPDSTRIQLRASLVDTLGNVVADMAMAEDDEIIVFSRSEFREPAYVAITGAVNRGGRFPYREGITVRDLVLLAGGLEQSALLTEAEVARLPRDRTDGRTAETFRIPLDSSYIFDRGADGRYIGVPGLPAPRGPSGDVVLQPYDNVLILQQPGWELQRTVSITGEVRTRAGTLSRARASASATSSAAPAASHARHTPTVSFSTGAGGYRENRHRTALGAAEQPAPGQPAPPGRRLDLSAAVQWSRARGGRGEFPGGGRLRTRSGSPVLPPGGGRPGGPSGRKPGVCHAAERKGRSRHPAAARAGRPAAAARGQPCVRA
jgi:polysaccharide biosynthesis/export protein